MKISIDYEGKIGEDYSIIRMLAIGGFGTVYLVKDNEKNIEYAAKTIDNDDSFKNEVQINEIVEKIDSLNIVKYISKGIKNVEYLGKSETKNYVVFEYCEYGDFFNYIPSGGFDEKVVKIVFKTLLEAVEKIHNKNVCHLDLKLENILVDKDFNLKISDFGLSNQINEINNGIFKKNCGTSYYKPPQMILGLSYNGIKADIFSLGVILFALLSARFLFIKSDPRDNKNPYYYIKRYGIEFLEQIQNFFPQNSTRESRQLFLDMVAYEESYRPEIKNILKNKWFDEIKDISDKDKKTIIKEIIEMKLKEKNENQNKTINHIPKEKNNESKYIDKLFDETYKIKCLKKKIKLDNYLQIKGNLNPIDFMNEFANKMEDTFDDIETNNNNHYLNFDIIIKKKEEEKEKKEEKEEKEEKENENEKINAEEKIDINLEINNLALGNIDKLEKDLIIQVELIKINDNEHLLNFIKVKGALRDYYQKLKDIMSDAEALISGK